jgi:hypothetical protein
MSRNDIKERLKSYLQFSPRERRINLEEFIDSAMTNKDILDAINYVERLNKNGYNNNIVEMGYSDAGDFYVKTENGMTFLR